MAIDAGAPSEARPRQQGAAGNGRRLVRWYGRRRRDLPWRRDVDPYRVWVSEVMLQQTTVSVAGPYFVRFVRRWPTLESLAGASEPEVLAAWSGLGYYHRARNLLRAARQIRERHGGRVPADAAALRDLPGVGAYTAGAILSIGHNLPYPAVDGNVSRVVARLAALRGDPARPAGRRAVERVVRAMMPPGRAGAFNQALMDLGATVCTPRQPRCGACPVSAGCEALRLGKVDRIPPAKPSLPARQVDLAAVVVRRQDSCLLVRREAAGLMRGLWEFPTTPARGPKRASEVARRLGARLLSRTGEVRHTITRHRMRVAVYEAAPAARRRGTPARGGRVLVAAGEPAGIRPPEPSRRLATSEGPAAARWVSLERLAAGEGPALTGAARKIARMLRSRTSPGRPRDLGELPS